MTDQIPKYKKIFYIEQHLFQEPVTQVKWFRRKIKNAGIQREENKACLW